VRQSLIIAFPVGDWERGIVYLGNKINTMSNDNNIDTLGNWLLAIGVIFILFVGGIFLGILNIECWTLKEKYEYGTKALTTVGLIFGGIVGLINAFFAAKRAAAMEETAKAANENAKAANKSAKAANKNAKAAQDKQITERFAKAIEQLASEKIEVRLGAIYTLERIARDSKKDQWTIMEVLTAFVRENAPVKKEEKSQDKKPLIHEFLNTQNKKKIEELPKLRLDIQECLTVIGRREHPDPENKSLDLSNVDISKANLTKAKLAKAYLAEANLTGAYLAEANLTEAYLFRAKLFGADLTEAKLFGAFLTKADFTKANLTKANLFRAELFGADLTKSDLTEADLTKANLFRAKLFGADLTGANLTGANLTKADLTGADLTEANLAGANLTEAYRREADFTKVQLTEADLTEADLTEALLKGATMPDGSIHD
jgi:uncharacterized protein YjbI with pentapeptide repeats